MALKIAERTVEKVKQMVGELMTVQLHQIHEALIVSDDDFVALNFKAKITPVDGVNEVDMALSFSRGTVKDTLNDAVAETQLEMFQNKDDE